MIGTRERNRASHPVRLRDRVRAFIPEGRALPVAAWRSRHRTIVILLFLQAAGLVVFAVQRGFGLRHGLIEALPVAAAAVLGGSERLGRGLRSCVATLGLVASSAILVHLSGGTIEAHFHFFVMLGVISLYQSWGPFLLSIAFVVLHHGAVGALDTDAVYNHPAAWANPWRWAAIHGAFVLAASVAQLVTWRFSEAARAHSESILESAGEGMVGTDASWHVTFVNGAAARMLGVEPAAAMGRPVHDLLRLTDGEGRRQSPEDTPLGLALREGVTGQGGDAFLARGDERFPVELVSTPIRRRGEIVGVVTTFRDATERRRADEDRKNTLSLLAATLESTADGILVVDSDGRITSFNQKFAEMWRIPDQILASKDDD